MIWTEHGELDPCEVPGNDERAVGILDKVDGKVDSVDANQDFKEFDCEEMLRHMEPEMLSSVGSQNGLPKMEGLEPQKNLYMMNQRVVTKSLLHCIQF
jgi:hypothetical protein